MSFEHKVIIITGGANGIGRHMVKRFVEVGATVAVIDKDDYSKSNISCDYYYCGDIAEEVVLKDFVNQVINKYGKVDCLINNACLNKKGILSDCSFDDFNYVLKVGICAPYMLTNLLKNHFNHGAAVVNISSTRAGMSQPDTESYTAAKGGMSALTHGMAISLAGKIRVNGVSPGWIDTTEGEWSQEDLNQHPVKRIGKPEDISEIVMFLCSEKSSFINGQNIVVDGGMSKQMIYHGEYGWSYE